MARLQLQRPSPVTVFPTRVRRQTPVASMVPGDEEMEEPESPDSIMSSPSTVGGDSESEDSESEDEEDSHRTVKSAPSIKSSSPATVAAASSTMSAGAPSQILSSTPASKVSDIFASMPLPKPSPTQPPSSKGTIAAVPQSNNTGPAITASTQQAPTTTVLAVFSSKIARPDPAATSAVASPSRVPAPSALPETAGEQDPPRRSFPQDEHHALVSKGGIAAAIALSILGALAMVLAAVIFFKRRKRQHQSRQRLADDAFDPKNTGSLRAPETAHVSSDQPFITGSHLTRSTERSDFLFGGGSYVRPETVSTAHGKSRAPYATNSVAPPLPTPNPFADPPLNKAYDVLEGRPRSTTLTDRGSWIKNPFRNPESERFDPFGELKAKARKERIKHLEDARREAEMRRNEEFAAKEKMGLAPPQVLQRKGSGVTLEGVGVLDRSGAGGY